MPGMKYTTLLFFVALFLLLPHFANAQNDELNKEDLKEWSRNAQTVPVKSSSEVEGTPYYNEEWKTGYVLLNSGKKSDPIDLKYNSYTNEVLFQKNGRLLAVVPKGMKGFILLDNNQQTVFKSGFKSEKHDISPATNLRVIYDGSVKLVAQHNVRQHKRRDILGGGNQVIKYLPKTDYYLINADGTFHDVKLKRKHILRALGNHQGKLKNFANSQDLSFKDQNDLRSILIQYDNMLARDSQK